MSNPSNQIKNQINQITRDDLLVVEQKLSKELKNSSESDRTKTISLEIEKSAKHHGFKAANLLFLEKICLQFQADPVSPVNIKVKVPIFCLISHESIENHLKKHALQFETLWKEFTIVVGEKQNLTPTAKDLLTKLQILIKEAFSNHALSLNNQESSSLKKYMNQLDPKNDLVIVRSSGMEDSANTPNRGGNISIPAVEVDYKQICVAIGEVIASYFSEKSIEQRLMTKDDITKPPFMPVFMQKMITESASTNAEYPISGGVMYTGFRGTLIQAAPGFGELIVNSKGAFDTYYVTNEFVVHGEIRDKFQKIIPVISADTGKYKLENQENEYSQRSNPTFSQTVVKQIAQIGHFIERNYGEAMDVEFVYDKVKETIYLVQARALPEGDLRYVVPSSINPEKVERLLLKSPFLRGGVTVSAGNAAKTITSMEEIIVCQTLAEGYLKYLESNKKDLIKAVIIEEAAAEMSHEGGQLSSKAIPVLYFDNIELILEWLAEEDIVLIIDPQRKLIVNLSGQTPNELNRKLDYINSEIIIPGLFKSHMSALETVLRQPFVGFRYWPTTLSKSKDLPKELGLLAELAGNKINPLNRAAFAILCQSLFETLKTDNHPFSFVEFKQLPRLIEKIENAIPGQTNKEAFEALRMILQRFVVMAYPKNKGFKKTTSKDKDLFRQAMILGREIFNALQELSNHDILIIPKNKIDVIHQSLLNLAVKLEALVFAKPTSGMSTFSLYQVALERKLAKEASQFKGFDRLNSDQQSFFIGLFQVHKLALNQNLSQAWLEFLLFCCQEEKFLSELVLLTTRLKKYNILSEWLNGSFKRTISLLDKNSISSGQNYENVLQIILFQANLIKNELDHLNYNKLCSVLSVWQQRSRLEAWSMQDQYPNILKAFETEILPIMRTITISSNQSELTQVALLNYSRRLTEVLDHSIKSLKGSFTYTNRDLQSKRFAEMLTPFFHWMCEWYKLVPESKFREWKVYVRDKDSNKKDVMLEHIINIFKEKSKNITPETMLPSRAFDVSAITIGSASCFSRHFIEIQNSITLEDLFTLIHQNAVAAIAFLKGNIGLPLKDLPPSLYAFLKYFLVPKQTVMQFNFPLIEIEYALPLRNHSATFYVRYDQNLDQCHFIFKFFGHGDVRMNKISLMAQMFSRVHHLKESPTPFYDHKRQALKGGWLFNSQQMNLLGKEIAELVLAFGEMTFLSESSNKYLTAMIPILFEKDQFFWLLEHKNIHYFNFSLEGFNFFQEIGKHISKTQQNQQINKIIINYLQKVTLTNAEFILSICKGILLETSNVFCIQNFVDCLLIGPRFPFAIEKQIKILLIECIATIDFKELCQLLKDMKDSIYTYSYMEGIIVNLRTKTLNMLEFKTILEILNVSTIFRDLHKPLKHQLFRSLLNESLPIDDFNLIIRLAEAETGKPVLIAEIEEKNNPLVQLLLARGVDPNQLDTHGTCALECAIEHYSFNPSYQKDIPLLLLERKADPNTLTRNGDPLLKLTLSHWSVMKNLLEKGANPYAKDKDGQTVIEWLFGLARDSENNQGLLRNQIYLALNLFIEHDHVKDYNEIVKLIEIELKTASSSGDNIFILQNITQLLHQILIKNPCKFAEMFQLVATSSAMKDSELQDYFKNNISRDLYKLSCQDCLILMAELRPSHFSGFLFKELVRHLYSFAIQPGNFYILIQALTTAEVMKGLPEIEKYHVIYSLLKKDLTEENLILIIRYCEKEVRCSLLEVIIKFGYQQNKTDSSMISVSLERVLKLKSDPNQLMNDGEPLLAYVITQGSVQDLKLFLDYGANPNAKTKSGEPLLKLAIPHHNKFALLCSKGANSKACDIQGISLKILALEFELKTYGKNSPIMNSLLKLTGAFLFKKTKSVIDQLDNQDKLYYEKLSQHFVDFIFTYYKTEVKMFAEHFQKLLSNGIDPDLRGSDGDPMIICAIKTKNLEALKVLLENSASTSITDKAGQTPLMIAKSLDLPEMVNLLSVTYENTQDVSDNPIRQSAIMS